MFICIIRQLTKNTCVAFIKQLLFRKFCEDLLNCDCFLLRGPKIIHISEKTQYPKNKYVLAPVPNQNSVLESILVNFWS